MRQSKREIEGERKIQRKAGRETESSHEVEFRVKWLR